MKPMTLKQKGYLGMGLWILALLGTINTNNNPNPILTIIFPIIRLGTGTSAIAYSGLIYIALLYIGYRLMKKNWQDIYPIQSRRIGAKVILSILIMSSLLENGIMVYKGFYNNLDGIYCYHENKQLDINVTDNKKAQVTCTLRLKNCTNKTQEFFIEVILPNDKYMSNNIKDLIKKTSLVAVSSGSKAPEKFVIRPRETAFIYAIFVENSSPQMLGSTVNSFSYKNFGFRLYNHEKAVEFSLKDEL